MKFRFWLYQVLFFLFMCQNTMAQIDSLIKHGEELFYNGEFHELYEMRDSFLISFQQNINPSQKRAVAKLIAYGYHENFKYEDAAEWYNQVLPLALADNEKEDLFFSYLNLGKCYTHMDSINRALDYFKLCGSYMDDNSLIQKFHLNFSLGFFFTREEKFDQAIYYDKNALAIAEAMKDTLKSMSVLYDISYLYDRKGAPDSTIIFLNEVASLLKDYPHPRYEWMVMACRGISNIRLENYKEGLSDLEKSMPLGESIGQDLCCGNRAHLGLAYVEVGAVEKAIQELNIAEQQVFKLEGIDNRRNVLHSLYRGFRGIGDETKALKYFELYQNTRDSINSQLYLNQVANYQVELGLDQLNAKLTLTRKKLDQISSKNRLLSVGLFLFLISTVLTSLMYIYKKKELKTIKDNFIKEFSLTLEDELSDLPHAVSDNSDEKFQKKLEELVLEHLNDDQLSVSLIAHHLGMSTRSLTRECRSKTGMTPGTFITFIKIEKAKLLLNSTPLNVNEIAYQCGYTDPSYFNKVFKNDTGLTPGEWKNKSRMAAIGK